MNTSKILLNESEAARLLGFSLRFLQLRRAKGDGPAYVRVSPRSIRYRPEDLERWAEERLHGATGGDSGAQDHET